MRTVRTPVRHSLLVAMLFACVIGRGVYALYLEWNHQVATTSGDAPSYLGPARQLAAHASFDAAGPLGRPEFLRTPGYPLFLATIFRTVGDTLTSILLVQVLLSALTIFLVYLVASRMWTPAVGLVAAATTLVEPLQNATTATVLTECLEAALLIALAGIGFAVFTTEDPPLPLMAMLGFVMAAATLVRPVTYYLPVLVVVLLFVRYAGRRENRVRLVKMTAAFLLPLVLLVGGWQFRNHERVDSWRVSGIEGKNLYKYRAAGVVAKESAITLTEAQHRLSRRFGAIGTESQGAYYGRMYRVGSHILATHPHDAFTGAVNGLEAELFSVRYKYFEYLGFQPASGPIAFAAEGLLLAFYGACAYGILLVARRRRDLIAHAFVLGIAAYVLLASAGPEALGGRGERFRAPIMPILILYAASGAYALWRAHGADFLRTLRLEPAAIDLTIES